MASAADAPDRDANNYDFGGNSGNTEGRDPDYVAFVVHGISPNGSEQDWATTVRNFMITTVRQRFRLEVLYQEKRAGNPAVHWEGLHESTARENIEDEFLGSKSLIEYIPIYWWDKVHEDMNPVIDNLGKDSAAAFYRTTARDLVADVLLYGEDSREKILRVVGDQINSKFQKFIDDNPLFSGRVVFIGHSLGSIILFDLLANQEARPTTEQIPSLRLNVPKLNFKTRVGVSTMELFMALGSPIGIFLAVRHGGRMPQALQSFPCRFLNVYHRLDPVAYRIEPLFSEEYALNPMGVPARITHSQSAAYRGKTLSLRNARSLLGNVLALFRVGGATTDDRGGASVSGALETLEKTADDMEKKIASEGPPIDDDDDDDLSGEKTNAEAVIAASQSPNEKLKRLLRAMGPLGAVLLDKATKELPSKEGETLTKYRKDMFEAAFKAIDDQLQEWSKNGSVKKEGLVDELLEVNLYLGLQALNQVMCMDEHSTGFEELAKAFRARKAKFSKSGKRFTKFNDGFRFDYVLQYAVYGYVQPHTAGLFSHSCYFKSFDGGDVAHLLLKTLQAMNGQPFPTTLKPSQG